MISLKQEGGSSRTKVEFPLLPAVDNVVLRNVELNPNIVGLQFNFQRVEDETIAFFSDTLLPPKKEWYDKDIVRQGVTITAEESFKAAERSWVGYIRHILQSAGIPSTTLDTISGADSKTIISNIVSIANPMLEVNRVPMYLKVTLDNKGYKKLPKFRGTGTASPMVAGYPSKFAYTSYEQTLIDESSSEGFSDGTIDSRPKATGVDF